MNIKLKELFAIDWESDQNIVLDENRTCSVTAYIGSSDSEGTVGFTITLCNTDYVKKNIAEKGYFSGLWHLVLDVPTYENVEKFFLDQIEQISEETWEGFVTKLRRVANWEFEDYNETFKK